MGKIRSGSFLLQVIKQLVIGCIKLAGVIFIGCCKVTVFILEQLITVISKAIEK